MKVTPIEPNLLDQIVEPRVSTQLNHSSRIGLALAIDWIAMRGQSATLCEYHRREDEAMRDLVTVLSEAPASLVKQVILGTALENQSSNEKPVDPSIFFDIGVTEAEFDTYSWGMLLVDTNSDETGQIILMRGSRSEGWRNLNVNTDFLLEHLPPLGERPRQFHSTISKAVFKDLMIGICEQVPVKFRPLTQREFEKIAKQVVDRPPRGLVREIAKELITNFTQGPRPGKRGEREAWFEGFLETVSKTSPA
jgi:hypothetical protein